MNKTQVIIAIAQRAKHLRPDIYLSDIAMAVSLSDEYLPLDLDGLLVAPTDDFLHDVFGIMQKLDMPTGLLSDCFCPRYAVSPGDAPSAISPR